MDPRFVTKTMHAYLDYPAAISLMVPPFGLGLGGSHPLALWLAVVTGVAAFVLTLFTNHNLGVTRTLPYGLHVSVDRLVGVVFVAAPFVLRFTGLDAWYHLANGAVVLLVTSLHKPEQAAMARARAALPFVRKSAARDNMGRCLLIIRARVFGARVCKGLQLDWRRLSATPPVGHGNDVRS